MALCGCSSTATVAPVVTSVAPRTDGALLVRRCELVITTTVVSGLVTQEAALRKCRVQTVEAVE